MYLSHIMFYKIKTNVEYTQKKLHAQKATIYFYCGFFSGLDEWPGIAVFLQNALIFFR